MKDDEVEGQVTVSEEGKVDAGEAGLAKLLAKY